VALCSLHYVSTTNTNTWTIYLLLTYEFLFITVIRVPGIKIPWDGGYCIGTGLDDETRMTIEAFNPNCVHFTCPDFVALDAIRWCQRKNIAYMVSLILINL
jgi:hypothetical protein